MSFSEHSYQPWRSPPAVTHCRVQCAHCGAQGTVPAAKVTLVVDLTCVQPTVILFVCGVCGLDNEGGPIPADVEAVLETHCTLAVAQPLQPF